MRKTNRMLAILAAVAVMTGSITGCGGSARDTSNTTAGETAGGSSYGASSGSMGRTDGQTSNSSDAGSETTLNGASTEEDMAMYPALTGMIEAKDACAPEACYDTGVNDFYYDPYTYGYYENSESYQQLQENGFSMAMTNPLSTFAADVDTASYANVRRMIETGYSQSDIPAGAVRPEEFINYFSYDLAGPDKGEKFGVTTEVTVCPWNQEHQLLFVGVKAEDQLQGKMPKSNLVFLIDVSGSMASENKLDLLKKSFEDLIDNLPGEGTVSIVTYASEEKVVLEGADMTDKRAIKRALRSLSASGATAGERGMEMAYEVARDNYIEGGNNRIIMATDGDLNVGISDPDELEKFVEKKKEEGIFLSVLGFGDGNYKDDRLERIADCGNGNYNYIDSAVEAKKVLVDQMSSTLVTVAKDVKFQVEFNPAVVNGYRLIGYENRQMEDIAFTDDSKDGGEIGSGHSVVALYEIVPAGGKDAIELKYQKKDENTEDASDEYATIKIRYKEPEEDTSKEQSYVVDSSRYSEEGSENITFASLVAEFAMLLSDSEYAGNITYEDIVNTYNELGINDLYKNEFVQLVWMVEKRS